MCIIIAKNKTNRLPSTKELEYCFDYKKALAEGKKPAEARRISRQKGKKSA